MLEGLDWERESSLIKIGTKQKSFKLRVKELLWLKQRMFYKSKMFVITNWSKSLKETFIHRAISIYWNILISNCSWKNLKDMSMRFSIKAGLTRLNHKFFQSRNHSVKDSIMRFDILALLRLFVISYHSVVDLLVYLNSFTNLAHTCKLDVSGASGRLEPRSTSVSVMAKWIWPSCWCHYFKTFLFLTGSSDK